MTEGRRWLAILTSPWFALGLLLTGLAAGTWIESLPAFSQDILRSLQDGVSEMVEILVELAPIIILVSILPALLSLFDTGGGRAPILVVILFSMTTVVAGLYAILLAWPIFQLPITGQEASGVLDTLGTVADDLGASPPIVAVIWAFSAAILLHTFRVIGRRVDLRPDESLWHKLVGSVIYAAEQTTRVFNWIMEEGIQRVGKVLELALPFILFAVGAFVPRAVENTADLATERGGGALTGDPITLYLLTGLLVAVVTFAYLLAIAWLATRLSRTSLKKALTVYMPPVYSFAWATASSTATIPINLEAAEEGLEARAATREFVIPLGATINLDGTMMGAMLITPVVTNALGIPLSLTQLFAMFIPLLALTVGAPGIPGGLSIIAPPILATILGLTGAQAEAFIGVWFAFSLGLTDQFRTAVNSTNNGFLCLIVDRILGTPEQREVTYEEIDPDAAAHA